MLMLDTDMLSEIMRPEPERKIADWIVRQPSDELFTAAVCQAEILSGLAIMLGGRRRADLEEAAPAMFADDSDGRILPFDIEAAAAYADSIRSAPEGWAVERDRGSHVGGNCARAQGERGHPQRGRLRGCGCAARQPVG
ncbi:PIN domain-containing protein [Lichenicoccus sp.]|uniref:PIN domain-containing protein n=1 Tax=Lichenicoccus sp. TaxID=2781899 RepID=UPI003D1279F7